MFQVNEQCFGRYTARILCSCSPTVIIMLPPHAHNHWLWQLTKEKTERMHKLTGWCFVLRLTSWNTRSSSLLSRSGLVDHGVDHGLDPSLPIFHPCFWLRKRLECDTCTFDRVSFVWLTLAIATIPFYCFFFLPCRTLPADYLQCLARRLARPFQVLSKHVGTSLCCGTRLAEI